MNLFDYIEMVNKRIQHAYDTNDQAEMLRLVTLLRDTLNDKIREWGG